MGRMKELAAEQIEELATRIAIADGRSEPSQLDIEDAWSAWEHGATPEHCPAFWNPATGRLVFLGD